jgi:hypothetical protein
MKYFLRAVLLVALAGLAGCTDSDSRPPATPLRTATTIERRATMSILRRVWEERPADISHANFWYERRLLDRSAIFGRRVRDTESYNEACTFWMNCVRQHVDRYDDDLYKRR